MSSLSTNPGSVDLGDVLLSIHRKLTCLQWIEVVRANGKTHTLIHEPRLKQWAIAAAAKTTPEAIVHSALSARPAEKHWYFLLSILPDAALYALDGLLDRFFEEKTA
jgi:hypothetical protein